MSKVEEDPNDERAGGQESRAELKTPGSGTPTDLIQCQVSKETQGGTESGPHLPGHDQTIANGCRDVLGEVDWDSRRLCAHANVGHGYG